MLCVFLFFFCFQSSGLQHSLYMTFGRQYERWRKIVSDGLLQGRLVDWVCCFISTEASATSCVRLSLKYHSFAVLSEWHTSLLSSCSSICISLSSFFLTLRLRLFFRPGFLISLQRLRLFCQWSPSEKGRCHSSKRFSTYKCLEREAFR